MLLSPLQSSNTQRYPLAVSCGLSPSDFVHFQHYSNSTFGMHDACFETRSSKTLLKVAGSTSTGQQFVDSEASGRPTPFRREAARKSSLHLVAHEMVVQFLRRALHCSQALMNGRLFDSGAITFTQFHDHETNLPWNWICQAHGRQHSWHCVKVRRSARNTSTNAFAAKSSNISWKRNCLL